MIGDGVTNWAVDATPAYVEMGYYHGLYQTSLHEELSKCNLSYIDVNSTSISDHCMSLVDQFNNDTSHIFVYDIYRPWILSTEEAEPETAREVLKRRLQFRDEDEEEEVVPRKTNRYDLLGYDYTPWLNRGQKKVAEEGPCPYESPLVVYFNQDEVKEQLHVQDYPHIWDMCNYTYNYNLSMNGSQWIWEELHGEGYRLLKYSGDTDGSVPTIGTEKWINMLGWDVLETYRPYYLPNGELGGYIEERDGLTFATVHGAGHMVPQFKRPEAVYLIKNWLQGNSI